MFVLARGGVGTHSSDSSPCKHKCNWQARLPHESVCEVERVLASPCRASLHRNLRQERPQKGCQMFKKVHRKDAAGHWEAGRCDEIGWPAPAAASPFASRTPALAGSAFSPNGCSPQGSSRWQSGYPSLRPPTAEIPERVRTLLPFGTYSARSGCNSCTRCCEKGTKRASVMLITSDPQTSPLYQG